MATTCTSPACLFTATYRPLLKASKLYRTMTLGVTIFQEYFDIHVSFRIRVRIMIPGNDDISFKSNLRLEKHLNGLPTQQIRGN